MDDGKMGAKHRLERRQFIPRPRSEVFAFFTDAANLERLTPKFLRFHILTPLPIVIRPGALIDYELRLYGVRMHWQTLIESVENDTSFTDVQLRGPYRFWRHEHAFLDAPGGTTMLDMVDYALPLGPLGLLAKRLLVSRSLEEVFDYRARVIGELLLPG